MLVLFEGRKVKMALLREGGREQRTIGNNCGHQDRRCMLDLWKEARTECRSVGK